VSYGLLLLRVVLGGIMFAHGAQKLFGWFGGHGRQGTAGFFGSLGFRGASALAVLVGLAEASGVLLALGFLTPLAAFGIAVVMVVAIATVHWTKGFFAGNGGYEFNLLILAGAVALAATGPGRFSIDNAIGWADNISGVVWGSIVLVAALAVGFTSLTLGRARPQATEVPV
jgi:putative oxidoreductase